MNAEPEARELTPEEQAYIDAKRPPEKFGVKVARLADGPAAGRLMRVKSRAILVPFWLSGETEANPGPRPVLVILKYRRAPGHFPDGSQRYVHVIQEGAW